MLWPRDTPYVIETCKVQCPAHGFTLFPGKAIVNGATGMSDFPGDKSHVTMSIDTKTVYLRDVWKCCVCGASFSIGEIK
jgi:hypothetical protein